MLRLKLLHNFMNHNSRSTAIICVIYFIDQYILNFNMKYLDRLNEAWIKVNLWVGT